MPIEMSPEYLGSRPLANRQKDLAVCILAAGVARRLEPISAVIAKPAFPLGGRIPIAELWVRKFVEAGIPAIAMNLHRVPESIRSYFGNGNRFLADITYVYEGWGFVAPTLTRIPGMIDLDKVKALELVYSNEHTKIYKIRLDQVPAG